MSEIKSPGFRRIVGSEVFGGTAPLVAYGESAGTWRTVCGSRQPPTGGQRAHRYSAYAGLIAFSEVKNAGWVDTSRGHRFGARAASWLVDDGLFVANLDIANIKLARDPAGRKLVAGLRRPGLEYHRRRRVVASHGKREIVFPFRYVGADDGAGPNYTGQPAVDSFYEPSDTPDVTPNREASRVGSGGV